jgi:hypothetical protein
MLAALLVRVALLVSFFYFFFVLALACISVGDAIRKYNFATTYPNG